MLVGGWVEGRPVALALWRRRRPAEVFLHGAVVIDGGMSCIGLACSGTIETFARAWAGDGGVGTLAVHGLVLAGYVPNLTAMTAAFEVFGSGALLSCMR